MISIVCEIIEIRKQIMILFWAIRTVVKVKYNYKLRQLLIICIQNVTLT